MKAVLWFVLFAVLTAISPPLVLVLCLLLLIVAAHRPRKPAKALPPVVMPGHALERRFQMVAGGKP
jgi:hypothetical protein